MDRSDIELQIKEMLIERLNLPLSVGDITGDMQIFGPGENSLELDSVDGLELVVGLGNLFQVTVSEEEGAEVLATIDSMCNFVEKHFTNS